jgi:hypothetical protein
VGQIVAMVAIAMLCLLFISRFCVCYKHKQLHKLLEAILKELYVSYELVGKVLSQVGKIAG